MIKILLIILLVAGCSSNPHVNTIMKDLLSTPKCDPNNIYTNANDTKEKLKAKLIIANHKLNCHVDRTTILDEKFNNYSDLD